MNVGDLVRLSTLTTIFTDGRSSVTYKASKDFVFVCVLLGVEKRDQVSLARVLKKRRPSVVLGVSPPAKGCPAWDYGTASGRRLGELAGFDEAPHLPDKWHDAATRFLQQGYALDNLLPYPDPSRRALTQAAALYKFVPGFWYVLAGTEVVRALGTRALPKVPAGKLPWHGTRNAPPLEWYESREGVVMAVLPHPSGRNRWYNDRRSRAAAEKFLREARWSRGAHASWLAAAREKTG